MPYKMSLDQSNLDEDVLAVGFAGNLKQDRGGRTQRNSGPIGPDAELSRKTIVNRRWIGTPDRHPKGTPSFCVSSD